MNKRIKKFISKGLILSILFVNTPIDSLAGTLSEDTRYETFEGADININDILEESKVDIEIKGETLVNLSETKESLNRTSTHYDDIYLCEIDKIKSNTTYTVLYDFECDIDFTFETCYFGYSMVNPSIMQYQFSGNRHFAKKGSNIGTFNLTDTQLQDAKNAGAKYFQVRVFIDNIKLPKQYSTKNVRFLEGDWTSRKAPLDYFKGMKSVGQDDVDGHKIQITSRNKNLFIDDVVNQTGSGNGGNGKIYPSMFVNINTRCRSANPIKVKPNTTYYFSSNNKFYFAIAEFDKDNKQILENGWTIPAQGGKHTTSKNCQSIVLIIRKTDGTSLAPEEVYGNIQIEENDIETTYIAPSSSMKEVLLREPLRGLPNGTRDRVVKRNGKWYIERNCREVILNGSENWRIDKTHEFTMAYLLPLDNITDFETSSKVIITDNIVSRSGSDLWILDIEGCGVGAPHDKGIKLNLNKDKLNTTDVNGLKEWLSKNPLRVVYQVETPTYEPLNIDLTLDLYLDTTHISTNSTIPANLKVTVDRVANKAKEYIELAKENPTLYNISLARMWINLMRESILKNEFQDNINSVTEVSDMVLERKTVSANLDLYIKCENMLSMSLNTNSITFEDFSGVEDMDKENAVNISINSSLPYNLNSYLATDIQSSDKLNTMDKSILSIKENSELNYQKFSAINNKLILKSNCESGNNKQHNIDLKLNGSISHAKDVYKTTIKFEAEQI